MKYGCEGKQDVLNRLATMIVHAPNDFPPEFQGMDMVLAWATIEHGLKQLEEKDGRPEVMDKLRTIRRELDVARELFAKNEINPACHKLHDVEDILRPLKVLPGAQQTRTSFDVRHSKMRAQQGNARDVRRRTRVMDRV
jgi:hypothetical protein